MAKVNLAGACSPSHQFTARIRLILLLPLAGILVACGGGGKGDADSPWTRGEFEPASKFAAKCAAPRTGIDPDTGSRYPDKSGKTLDENNWLRSWTNHTYLWYNEVSDQNPALYSTPEYFDLLKTTARTPSGTPKDQFHFTYDTAEWNALSGSGVSAGYGVQWAIIRATAPGRDIRVAYTEPGTPATAQGVDLARGARVLEVNGINALETNTSTGVETLNRGLFPSGLGQTVELKVLDVGSDTPRVITLTSTSVTSVPVQEVKTLATDSGSLVGYILFNDHIATSERLLIEAIDTLASAGATELVLDLRYNGGGLLAISSQLAYMIAGDTATESKIFYNQKYNDKHPTTNPVTGAALEPVPFIDFAIFSAEGSSLPSLGLSRVYILAGSNTCSASEAIINGLRGVDVEVILIGETTCGKPYGFYPTDNCGTTYFSVQFKGNNHKGFGEYSDGFVPAMTNLDDTRVPGCAIPDDYDHALGDPLEARFAAALNHIETGECSPASVNAMARQKPGADSQSDGLIHKPKGLRSTIMQIPGSGASL